MKLSFGSSLYAVNLVISQMFIYLFIFYIVLWMSVLSACVSLYRVYTVLMETKEGIGSSWN